MPPPKNPTECGEYELAATVPDAAERLGITLSQMERVIKRAYPGEISRASDRTRLIDLHHLPVLARWAHCLGFLSAGFACDLKAGMSIVEVTKKQINIQVVFDQGFLRCAGPLSLSREQAMELADRLLRAAIVSEDLSKIL